MDALQKLRAGVHELHVILTLFVNEVVSGRKLRVGFEEAVQATNGELGDLVTESESVVATGQRGGWDLTDRQ